MRLDHNPRGNGGALLPPAKAVRADSLLGLQVTTRSMLGTVVDKTGGVSTADGLLRPLGSGAGRSPCSATAAAGGPLDGSYPDVLVVADDVVGGLFALNAVGSIRSVRDRCSTSQPMIRSGLSSHPATPTLSLGA